ncbi:hypothetical protein ACFO0N_04215 [Halobium salinum]|uniref:Uncharacterized protein n=1 Tax=Halobium salinum TaxID=1364940 RepID=A0ABD5P8W7_9EURY|nr:hypothetical protein [Halobium salinum]
MRLRTVGAVLGALLLVLAAAVGGLYLFVDWRIEDSYYSSYHYDVSLSTNETLENVTLYLPVPMENGTPLVANATLAADEPYPWLETRVNATHAASVVDTEQGPMLAVEAAELIAPERYAVHYFDEDGNLERWEVVDAENRPAASSTVRVRPFPTTYELSVSLTVDERIDTRDPVANAATLSPRGAAEAVACEGPSVSDVERCFAVRSLVYAEYEASDAAVVDLRVEFSGWNEYGFGLYNSYNEYDERFGAAYRGGQDGWLPLDGERRTGVGNYRDGSLFGSSETTNAARTRLFVTPAPTGEPCAPRS